MSDMSDIYNSLNRLGDLYHASQVTIESLRKELREKDKRIKVLEEAVKGPVW